MKQLISILLVMSTTYCYCENEFSYQEYSVAVKQRGYYYFHRACDYKGFKWFKDDGKAISITNDLVRALVSPRRFDIEDYAFGPDGGSWSTAWEPPQALFHHKWIDANDKRISYICNTEYDRAIHDGKDNYDVTMAELFTRHDIYKPMMLMDAATASWRHKGTPSWEFWGTVHHEASTGWILYDATFGISMYYQIYRNARFFDEYYLIHERSSKLGEGHLRDAVEMKIAYFKNVYYFPQDVFLAANKLETIVFDNGDESCFISPSVFNTKSAETGVYRYPKLTTFVVPDNHYATYYQKLNACTTLIGEGHAVVIPMSLFLYPRVTGVSTLSRVRVKDRY